MTLCCCFTWWGALFWSRAACFRIPDRRSHGSPERKSNRIIVSLCRRFIPSSCHLQTLPILQATPDSITAKQTTRWWLKDGNQMLSDITKENRTRWRYEGARWREKRTRIQPSTFGPNLIRTSKNPTKEYEPFFSFSFFNITQVWAICVSFCPSQFQAPTWRTIALRTHGWLYIWHCRVEEEEERNGIEYNCCSPV